MAKGKPGPKTSGMLLVDDPPLMIHIGPSRNQETGKSTKRCGETHGNLQQKPDVVVTRP